MGYEEVVVEKVLGVIPAVDPNVAVVHEVSDSRYPTFHAAALVAGEVKLFTATIEFDGRDWDLEWKGDPDVTVNDISDAAELFCGVESSPACKAAWDIYEGIEPKLDPLPRIEVKPGVFLTPDLDLEVDGQVRKWDPATRSFV